MRLPMPQNRAKNELQHIIIVSEALLDTHVREDVVRGMAALPLLAVLLSLMYI
jgi:hypothetical protein